VFQKKVEEKIKTHTLGSITVFRKSGRLRDNVEKYCTAGRPQMTMWRMRFACSIPRATNTHSQFVTLIAFSLQQWLHERTSALRHMYIALLFGLLLC